MDNLNPTCIETGKDLIGRDQQSQVWITDFP